MKRTPRVLRSGEAARLLNLSPDSVNALARKGLLKGRKEGRQWRFRRKDVEDFLNRSRQLYSAATASQGPTATDRGTGQR